MILALIIGLCSSDGKIENYFTFTFYMNPSFMFDQDFKKVRHWYNIMNMEKFLLWNL